MYSYCYCMLAMMPEMLLRLLLLLPLATGQQQVRLLVDLGTAISHTNPAFISFNIDAAEILLDQQHPKSPSFPWASPLLIGRARHLAPWKLRIGGGAQSRIAYDEAFLARTLPLITGLARQANASLVWGTAPCSSHRACDLSHAEALLASEAADGIAEYEYGNEPSSSESIITATTLANNFVAFHKLLQKHRPGVPLIGPDVGFGAWHSSPSNRSAPDAAWLSAFFKVAAPVLSGATVHIYPFDHNDVGGDNHYTLATAATLKSSRGGSGSGDPICAGEAGATWAAATAAAGANLPWCNYTRVLWPGPGELFDTRPVQDFALPFAEIARRNGITDFRIGETAAVNHGGWDNVTNAFVSGFWSVYQMGWLAQKGYAVMHRQSLTCRGGDSGMGHGEHCSYGVLGNAPTFEPTPDFWLSLLHTRLMGTTVLNTTVYTMAHATGGSSRGADVIHTPKGLEGVVRLFAHCAKGVPGGATLMFANPQTVPMSVELPSGGLVESERELYTMTPAATGESNGEGRGAPLLQSKEVALNGVRLAFSGAEGTALPDGLLTPVKHAGGGALVLPRLAYGFVVLPQAWAPACQ